MKILLITFFFLFLISLVRGVFVKTKISFLFYCILFGLSGLNMFPLFAIASTKGAYVMSQFGVSVSINILGVLSFVIFFDKFRKGNVPKDIIYFFLFLFCLCILSFINPYNQYYASTWPPVFFFIQLFLFVILIRRRYSDKLILHSLYEALSCWVLLEFILVICYPILGIESVASLFKGDLAASWSMRREGYLSAVGTFVHPGNLAYVISCYGIFFLSSFFSNYRKRESLTNFLLCCFIVFFTFARTAYMALALAIIVLLLLYRGTNRNIRKIFVLYICLGGGALYLLTFIPVINDLFLKSDSSEMIEGRTYHLYMGWDILQHFPILGTGLNCHVNYMYHHTNMSAILGVEGDFFLRSPIHNSHMIVLVETGIVGFLIYLSSIIYIIRKQILMYYKKNARYTSSMLILGVLIFFIIYGFGGWSIYNVEVLTPVVTIICLTYNNKEERVPCVINIK